MPVNWSLLNPSLPAQAQTINPFAAFQAGREQAEQRIQNQQAGELRGAQIKGLQAELTDRETGQTAANLAAQAWQLRETDPAAAAQLLERGLKANSKAFIETTKQLQEQARLEAERAQKDDEAKRKFAIESAPFMAAAVAKVDELKQQNPNATPEEIAATAEGLMGAFWRPQYAGLLADDTQRARVRDRVKLELSQNDNYIKEQQFRAAQAERAADNAARDRRDAATESRFLRTLAARERGQGDDLTAADRDIARYNRIKALGDRANPGEQQWAAGFEKKNDVGASVNSRIVARHSNNLNEGIVTLANVLNMAPDLASIDVAGMGLGSHPGASLMQSTKDLLRLHLSGSEANQYNTIVSSLVRQAAGASSPGYAVDQATEKRIQAAVEFREGETGFDRMIKTAEAAQIFEQSTKAVMLIGGITREQRRDLENKLEELHQVVPYTVRDVQNFQRATAREPNLTMAQFLERKRASAPARLGTSAAPLNLGQGISIPGVGAPAAPAPARPAARPATPANGGGWSIQRIE